MRKSLFTIRHQDLVQVGIRTGDCDVLNAPGESQFICFRSKGYAAAEVLGEFGTTVIAAAVR
jgi:hypothetical protein